MADHHDDEIRRSDFPEDFTWGVATAAYQIEGGWNADGKGPSIWDTFTRKRWRIRNGDTGEVACDSYHRYGEDVVLAAGMGFGANRFSISWPRVLPEGTGRINPAGIDYYSRLVDACLEVGLDPWVTLYHWDLPQALQDRGGWANRDVLGWWEEYVGVMADALGDRVRHWMAFNEPLSFCVVGHLLGVHAPGVRSLNTFLAAVHHTNLCQAVAARVLRARVPGADVGTTQYLSPVLATGHSRIHLLAQRSGDAFVNRMFVEPNLGLGYPTDDCGLLHGVERFVRDGDDEAIRVDWDFLGVQYYTRLKCPPLPIPRMWTAPLFGRDFRNFELTSTGWEVRPDGLYDVLARAHSYGRFPRLVVTENGAAFPDRLSADGTAVHDPRRVAFYRAHLAEVRRALADGIPVDGYFCWSLLDNFEWAEGYRARFGITYVDYATQRRVPKDSGRWFAAMLSPDGTP
jgi:beta-glucosidase